MAIFAEGKPSILLVTDSQIEYLQGELSRREASIAVFIAVQHKKSQTIAFGIYEKNMDALVPDSVVSHALRTKSDSEGAPDIQEARQAHLVRVFEKDNHYAKKNRGAQLRARISEERTRIRKIKETLRAV